MTLYDLTIRRIARIIHVGFEIAILRMLYFLALQLRKSKINVLRNVTGQNFAAFRARDQMLIQRNHFVGRKQLIYVPLHPFFGNMVRRISSPFQVKTL